jgi:hypothetical protein
MSSKKILSMMPELLGTCQSLTLRQDRLSIDNDTVHEDITVPVDTMIPEWIVDVIILNDAAHPRDPGDYDERLDIAKDVSSAFNNGDYSMFLHMLTMYRIALSFNYLDFDPYEPLPDRQLRRF